MLVPYWAGLLLSHSLPLHTMETMHNTNTERDLALIRQDLAEAVRLLRLILESKANEPAVKRRAAK